LATGSAYDELVKSRRDSRSVLVLLLLVLLHICAVGAQAQVIEFESGGLRYKAMTVSGVTVMFAPLTARIRDYTVLQVAISNGSNISWTVKPEDFSFEKAEGPTINALPARTVVDSLIQKASRGDVIKLVAAYENSLYNNTQIHSTNGYESRRQNAFAEVSSGKLKAAAAASAISLVTTKLKPGQSTDGAVFYTNQGKALGTGMLVVHTAGETFTFPIN
jgi:hypothetical protein